MTSRGGYHRFLIVVVIALTIGIFASPENTDAAWTVGEPIVTYWSGSSYGALTEEIAQQAVDGGYNLVWINNADQLAIAEKYGLRALWRDNPASTPIITPASLDTATPYQSHAFHPAHARYRNVDGHRALCR